MGENAYLQAVANPDCVDHSTQAGSKRLEVRDHPAGSLRH